GGRRHAPTLSGHGRNYDAFRRAPPAAAGRRPPHTYHQYASGWPPERSGDERSEAGQRRPVQSPGYAPYFRPGPRSHQNVGGESVVVASYREWTMPAAAVTDRA